MSLSSKSKLLQQPGFERLEPFPEKIESIWLWRWRKPGCALASAGILQEAMGRGEYWRLVDSQGRPPGVLGMWPSRSVTFVDNHDTGQFSSDLLSDLVCDHSRR